MYPRLQYDDGNEYTMDRRQDPIGGFVDETERKK
jgi:hypothetical protein